MKTLLFILAFTLLTGCKKDLNKCIIGNWKFIGFEDNGSFSSDPKENYITFNSSGDYTSDIKRTDGSISHTIGNYQIDGNIITLNGNKSNAECTESKLKMKPINAIIYSVYERH